MKTTRLLVCALLGAAGLAACGGDPASVATPALTEVPAASAATPAAYTEFAQQQAADDTAEPLSLDTFAEAPVSESDDPVALN
jgi:ABC-type glycerol-3-phosphate transport system substrate-binding protein